MGLCRFASGLLQAVFICGLPLGMCALPAHSNDSSLPPVEAQQIKAEVSAQDILLNVSKAVNSLNYEASLVVFRPGSEPVPYIWRHGIFPDTTVEYLNSLNGPGAQVVRLGDKVSFFEADKPAFALQQSHIHGPLPHNLIRNPEAIFAAYDVVLVGKSRVTGKAALHFRILSKDGSRYSYALWVDSETYLPLKLNTLTLKGEVLEQVQVTNLVITEKAHPDFLQLEAQNLPPIRHINPTKEFSLKWSITSLPVGMQEVKRDIHRLAITGELVEYKLLSDGLIDVSIYLQKAGSVPQDDVLIRNQSETFLSRVRDGLQLTVVGKVPAPTANKIMEMIALNPQ